MRFIHSDDNLLERSKYLFLSDSRLVADTDSRRKNFLITPWETTQIIRNLDDVSTPELEGFVYRNDDIFTLDMGFMPAYQWLKFPTTDTDLAFGAQTTNLTPLIPSLTAG